MALVSLRQLLDHAAEHGYGLPAFNVNNLEQVRAVMEAADKVNSPVFYKVRLEQESMLEHLLLGI